MESLYQTYVTSVLNQVHVKMQTSALHVKNLIDKIFGAAGGA